MMSTPRSLADAGRLKRVAVPEHAVLDWFRLVTTRAMTHIALPVADVPDDAEVQAVRHDYRTRSFVFVVWHPSFDPVPPGGEIPLATETVRVCQCSSCCGELPASLDVSIAPVSQLDIDAAIASAVLGLDRTPPPGRPHEFSPVSGACYRCGLNAYNLPPSATSGECHGFE